MLRDQRVIAGIGRAWANEILHHAKLSPYELTRDVTPEQVEALANAIDAELTRGLELREQGANDKRTYRVHKKLGEPCYVCGTADCAGRLRGTHDLLLPRMPDRWASPQGPTPVTIAALMSNLLQALYRGDRATVDELLAADPSLDVFEAAAVGRTNRLRELLDEDPARANAFGDDGFHPLGLACFFGHVDAARLLLERGADVNALSRNEHVQTAAIHAAAAAEGKDESVRYELVQLALEHGADPNLSQGGGFTAIDAARQNGDERVEQLLLDHGARP